MTPELVLPITMSIDRRVLTRFPTLAIEAFVAGNLDRIGMALTTEVIHQAWTDAVAGVVSRGISRTTVSGVGVVQAWRNVLAACGVPRDACRGTVERTLSRLFEGRIGDVPLFTFCTAVAIRHLAPVSAYDIDALPTRNICIRPSEPSSDWFLPLGARPTDVPMVNDAVVYAAGRTVVAWCFGHHESRQTCLRRNTARAVFVSEALAGDEVLNAHTALEDLRVRLASCGAYTGPAAVIDSARPTAMLSIADRH